ncbi:hypothetical protein JCM3775_004146 [Rhodotorula graminis]|uniref:Ricin B lectin domain-containing protein n=1 Tax=Rhodotorula graminis (strain WP1) TaxID=578459 RepID=A0A0P9ELB6_RHOGW|nr:uncharacterized protein RHOBADRAFT_66888 [Rhodotorula graminis WP1]KPV72519.1 hypothetical protein RHOBADRAFT_66888 [Rhodotorula graminis WP1]
MLTTTTSLALLGLASTAVNAAGIVDNLQLFSKLTSLAATHYEGEYKIQNVATGDYLHFDRPADTTNLVTSSSPNTVTLGHDSAYGQSGVKWDTWTGTYITGMSKCVSAQWDADLGVDGAAVSYACKVGGASDGSDSLEVAKQFWKLVPCGSSSSSSEDDSSSSDDVADTDNSVQFNAASSSSGSKLAAHADFSASSSSSSSEDDSAPTTTSSASAPSKSVDKHDRSTWVCRHDGKWLARHYRYVTEAGHVECKDELEAYWASQKRRMARRSRVAHGAAVDTAVARREKRDDSTYCIIAVDHLTDMATRALTPDHISTFGGYSSLKLAEWNENDSSQHWRITSA